MEDNLNLIAGLWIAALLAVCWYFGRSARKENRAIHALEGRLARVTTDAAAALSQEGHITARLGKLEDSREASDRQIELLSTLSDAQRIRLDEQGNLAAEGRSAFRKRLDTLEADIRRASDRASADVEALASRQAKIDERGKQHELRLDTMDIEHSGLAPGERGVSGAILELAVAQLKTRQEEHFTDMVQLRGPMEAFGEKKDEFEARIAELERAAAAIRGPVECEGHLQGSGDRPDVSAPPAFSAAAMGELETGRADPAASDLAHNLKGLFSFTGAGLTLDEILDHLRERKFDDSRRRVIMALRSMGCTQERGSRVDAGTGKRRRCRVWRLPDARTG